MTQLEEVGGEVFSSKTEMIDLVVITESVGFFRFVLKVVLVRHGGKC